MHIHFNPVINETFNGKWLAAMLRLLPNFKGDWLLYCRLFSVFVRRKYVNVDVSVEGNKLFRVCLDISDPPQLTMVKKTRYDLGTALVIWFLLDPGDVFFDIGANSGYLSSVAAQKVGDHGLVISVEPNPGAFSQLLKRPFSNILPLNFAASDTCLKNFSVVKPFYRQSTGSFCVEGDGTRSISADYLYEKFNRPAVKLLKVDTEGMELLVLHGAKNMLSQAKPYVILELEERHSSRNNYKTTEVFEWLSDLGYHSYYFIDDSLASIQSLDVAGQGQILFSPKELTKSRFKLQTESSMTEVVL